MSRWKVLVSAPYLIPFLDEYRPILEAAGAEVVAADVHERLSEAELLRVIGDIDGVICGDDEFTERVLAAAPRLKVIAKWGTGTDSIDRAAAERRSIAVRNTPDAFTQPVADTTLGYILAFARNLVRMDRDMRTGAWRKPPSISLRECTLGVIGVGTIGRAVTRRARAFGMRVVGHDIRQVPPAFIEETGIQMLPKDDVLRQADFLTLHTDLNPSSRRLIGGRELALMKPTAVLINTSRGPVVDETALIDALQQHRIAGAGLDVFEVEPLPVDSPLRRMDNVLTAPHNSNSSPEAWRRVHESTIRQLREVLDAAPVR